MKNLIIGFLVVAFGIKAQAQTTANQTKKEGVGSVEVYIGKKSRDTSFTRSDTTTIRVGAIKIQINPKNVQVSTDTTKHKHHKAKNIENNWLGLDLGLCNIQNIYDNNPQKNSFKPFELRQSKSINVKLYVIQQRINLLQHRVNFDWGVGVTWNNFRLTGNNQNTDLLKDKNDGTLYLMSDSAKYTKNKFVTKYLTVPTLLEISLGKKDSWKAFRLAAGLEFNLLLEGWQKQVSAERGKEHRFQGDYNLSQLPINYVVRLGVGKLNFYGTYALTPMFNASQQQNHYMPKMYPWAIGVQINGL